MYLEEALKYNLDYRRCGLRSLKFQKNITDIHPGDTVIVVQVIISDVDRFEIVPERNSDYFIDYIIEF